MNYFFKYFLIANKEEIKHKTTLTINNSKNNINILSV